MRRVLLIAFHYPPVNVSSGLQRTLAFSRYLPEFGWKPAVLTASPCAYPSVSNEQMADIPADCRVERAFARDTSRHLTLFGRYPSILALPDRWVSWCIGGLPAGLKLIKQFSPDIIFSTYPIASAHLLGLMLSKLSGIPWVADFRDSMTEEGYPADPMKFRAYRWIEEKTVKSCARAIFTTPGAKQLYTSRYPQLSPDKWEIVANGYDETTFELAEKIHANKHYDTIRLIHSGILYPEERNPRHFYSAMAKLLNDGKITPKRLQIILRATGHDEYHRGLINEYGISDIVHLGEYKPYSEALQEMLASDGLLLFQAENCNHQIPAKLYEYIRAGRPIFAMTDPLGDTATELTNAGQTAIFPLNNEQAIAQGLLNFLDGLENNSVRGVDLETARRFDRRSRSKELAVILDSVNKAIN